MIFFYPPFGRKENKHLSHLLLSVFICGRCIEGEGAEGNFEQKVTQPSLLRSYGGQAKGTKVYSAAEGREERKTWRTWRLCARHMKLLFISNLYPSSTEPNRGLFNRYLIEAMVTVLKLKSSKVGKLSESDSETEASGSKPIAYSLQSKNLSLRVIAPFQWFPGQRFLRGREAPPEQEETGGIMVKHPKVFYTPGIFRDKHWKMYQNSIRSMFKKEIEEFKPDHIMIGFLYPDAVAVVPLCRDAGIPYSVRVNGSDFNLRIKQSKFRKMILDVLKNAPLVFCPGDALKDAMIAEGIDKKKITAFENGVDRELFKHRSKEKAVERLTVIGDRLSGKKKQSLAEFAEGDFEQKVTQPSLLRSYGGQAKGTKVYSVPPMADEQTNHAHVVRDCLRGSSAGSAGGKESLPNSLQSASDSPTTKVMLFVGNLVPVKQPDVVIEAFHALVTSYKLQSCRLPSLRAGTATAGTQVTGVGGESSRQDAKNAKPSSASADNPTTDQELRLLIIGDGKLRKKLERQVKRLGLADSVVFLGNRPHEEVALWMNVADVLCLCSKSEGMPNVVLEALASGLPVVATDVGACRDMLKDEPRARIVGMDGAGAGYEALGCRLDEMLRLDFNRRELAQNAKVGTWRDAAERIVGEFFRRAR